ncbi:MAG: YicC family protein [Candidatus Rokubacteria bacterium]|nr:YicC family protein [Candidatus Rokubacteria bacterium]
MTGFGRAEASTDDLVVTIEARSVNHRHLDVALRVPRALAALETDARKMVTGRLERGRIDISISLAPAPGRAPSQVRTDAALAHEYVAQARALAETLGLPADVRLDWVLERPGVFRVEEVQPPEPAAVWPVLGDALSRALDALVAQRTTEGAALGAELRALATALESQVSEIAARAPAAASRREERLRERLRALVGSLAIDESRILIEAAAWAEKTDVAEELARLRVHLTEVRAVLDRGGPLGRRLDFLVQELHREVNTIGSKADDLEVSQGVLTAKGIIEKLREQTQNLE